MAARSTGGTRVFRLAHRRPELVDWAIQARRLWDHWSGEAGAPLVGTEGTVVSGDVVPWATAMSATGAPNAITDDPPPGLPATAPAGPFLLDPAGGAIRAAATGRFLLGRVGPVVGERVTAVALAGDRAVVTTAAGDEAFDSLVVTAGSGTAPLVAPLGIDVPLTLVHHARFTYPLRDRGATPPCWLEGSGAWRPDFATYQHLAAPGRWAVGGHFPAEQVRWELGADAVVAASRDVVTRYVTECLDGVEPEVVETVYCDYEDGLGDGLSAARVGPVLALWGDNLFKFAPVIGTTVARAAADRSLPEELTRVGHGLR
jgi:sarcosine oxidase